MTRDECIKRIRAGLKARRLPGDPVWSVRGGRGTSWGWIGICAPPSACTWSYRLKAGAVTTWPEDYEGYDSGSPGYSMTPTLRARLAALLNLPDLAPSDGVSIPGGLDYYDEYAARAEGVTPPRLGVPYWD